MRYQNVTPFPGVFYDSHGHIRKELVKDILQKCVADRSLSFGKFLKQLCKFSTKKCPSSGTERLDFVLDVLPNPSFRKKWYKRGDQIGEKAIKNFFNSLYSYIVENHPALQIDSMDMKDVTWKKKSGMVFLRADRLHRLLEISRERQVPDESLALYIWAFLEAHSWYDVGSTEGEGYETFRSELEDLLKHHDREDLLALCHASEDDLESEPAIEVSIVSRTKEKSCGKSPFEFKKAIGGNLAEAQPESPESDSEFGSGQGSHVGMIETYRALLFQVLDAKHAVQELNAMSRYDDLEKHLPKVRDLEKKHLKAMGDIRSWLDLGEDRVDLPTPPSDLLISKTAAKRYVQNLEKAVRESLRLRQANLEETKRELIEEIRLAEIEEPEGLEHVGTLEELINVRESLKSKMQVPRILNRMHREGFDPGLIKDMSQEKRLELYERLASSSAKPPLLKDTLRYMIGENRFAGKLVDRQISSAVKIAEALLACDGTLPESFWAMLQRLSPDDPFKKTGEGKLFELLKKSQGIDMEGLDQAALGQEEKLPAWLIDRILLRRLLKLKPEKRISLVAERLKDTPHDADIGILMLRTLCELERYREALYLSSIGARIGWPGLNDEILREPLLRALLEVGKQLEKEKSFLKELFEDISWLVNSEEYVLVFLYLTYQSGMEDVYFNFKYQGAEAVQAARLSYPILTERLVTLNERNFFPRAPARAPSEDLLREGKDALLRFEESQEKLSCYSKWPPAFKYQAYLRGYLQEVFLSVKRHIETEELSPEEIIARAQAEENLPEAEGDAARNMRRFLEEQMMRLKIVSEALQTFSEEELRRGLLAETPSHEKEYDRVPEGSILQTVYKRITGSDSK